MPVGENHRARSRRGESVVPWLTRFSSRGRIRARPEEPRDKPTAEDLMLNSCRGDCSAFGIRFGMRHSALRTRFSGS